MKKFFARATITAATVAAISTGILSPASAASSIGGFSLPAESAPVPGENTSDNSERTVTVDGVALTPKEAKVIELTNNHRAANGVGRVRVDQQLVDQSREWSDQQFREKKMYHGDYNVFENVAKTYDQSAQSVFELWRNSPGHNANMLNPDVSRIGFATSKVGSDNYSYSTMQLMWE